MVLRGGFIVTDDQQFRLHDRARLLGFADRGLLRSLQPRLCGETDGMSTCRSRPVPPTPSAFASFRFPPNVIVLAVATEGYRLIQDESPTAASTTNYLTPVVAVLLGIAFVDERLTWNLLIGTAMILVGLWIAEHNSGEREVASDTLKLSEDGARGREHI